MLPAHSSKRTAIIEMLNAEKKDIKTFIF